MLARLSRPSPLLALTGVIAVAVATLVAMGRPPISTSGAVTLWGRVGPEQSQMLLDWYTPSHIVHGFLFYALLHLVARRWPVERRFGVALLLEAAWEIFENTPMIIDRYREATIALGYSGDSILNSVSDVLVMALGFWVARRMPVWGSVMVVALLEIVPLLAIRDNLTLNMLMLIAPSEAALAWQAGA